MVAGVFKADALLSKEAPGLMSLKLTDVLFSVARMETKVKKSSEKGVALVFNNEPTLNSVPSAANPFETISPD